MLASSLAAALLLQTSAAAPALELANGRWFDGKGFRERTLYAVDGVLTDARPERTDLPWRTLDLAGGFVVPPFAEAHNHNVHDGADAALRRYLELGVLYVANPNSLARSTTTIRAQVNRPDSIDATFAGGGLTASGGHPIDVARPMIERGIWSAADGDGGFFFELDSAAELAERWPAIRAQPRDFLKTYLLYSEEHARRRDEAAAVGWRGLDPALLPEIVRRGHAEGWRVAAHVETAADFRNALAAGVDEIAHLPGFRPLLAAAVPALGFEPVRTYAPETYALSDEDARRAGERGTVIVTTLAAGLHALESVPDGDPARAEADAMLGILVENLARLHAHGARLALGSDEYDIAERSIVDEFLALARLGVLEPAELLRAWCETTALAIFPERRIGRLEPGYEASFLVLGGDPLEDPERVRDVRLRVKQGLELVLGR